MRGDDTVTPPLLSTKYAPPRLRSDAVVRTGLIGALDASRAVVLVSAPPGYGKTTLVATWLAAGDAPAGWVALDPSDDDPAVFLAYLVAAVRRALPALDPSLEQTVPASDSPAALTPLLNALADIDSRLVVVLDDYHAIHERAVHDLVAFLATHLPAGARLVICTREDPPLPLARLRVRGELAEIRAGDLRLGLPEANEFFRRSMHLELSEAAVERLTERTEGWVAGLQLAGLSLQTATDPDAFVDAFDASDRYVVDYLADEALGRQTPEVRRFLEDTSVLDLLTGPLCDALTGRTDGTSMLAGLERANMFVASLDERREWFRYHPLFADLLRSTLSTERRAELHRRAAAWYGEHDLPLDAIRHSLAAGDHPEAARLMETVADAAMARGEFRTILGWCEALPGAVLDDHPSLRVAGAWAQFFTGDLAGAEATVGAVRHDLSGEARSGRVVGLEAWLANRRDDPSAERLARQAIELVEPADPVFASLAFTTLGEALVGHDVQAAVAAFEQAHALAQGARRQVLGIGTVYELAGANLVLGRRRAAEELCRRTISELVDRRGSAPPAVGMVHFPLGIALFEADELGQARQQFATGNELCDRAGLHVTMLGAAEWYEVLTLHALGETQQAWRRLEAVRRDAVRHGIPRVAIATTLLAARLLVVEGDPAAALRRLDDVPDAFSNLLGTMVDRVLQTRALVLLAVDRPAEALGLLGPAAQDERGAGRCGRLLSTLILATEAQARVGERASATRSLREAVELAAPEDARHAFFEPLGGVGRLLPDVRDAAPGFVDDVLARLGHPPPPVPSATSLPQQRRPEGASLAEPLTVRELEVLRLVVAGLSNSEIGRELYVTAGTAKWHVHNLIAKLDARDRVGLVARSRALGLI